MITFFVFFVLEEIVLLWHKNFVFKGIKSLLMLNLIRKGPIHGSEIQKKLLEVYGLDLPKPIVYMHLRKMEDMGLIYSDWKVGESGPAKRLYKITEEGYEFLKSSLDDLKKLKDVLNMLIDDLEKLG